MSVVGIDFGAQSTKIGVARNKGIDIVRICPAAEAPSLRTSNPPLSLSKTFTNIDKELTLTFAFC